MAITAKEYSEILESVLKYQLHFITEDPRYEESEYLQGQEAGLRIALEKIEASKFLTEEYINDK